MVTSLTPEITSIILPISDTPRCWRRVHVFSETGPNVLVL